MLEIFDKVEQGSDEWKKLRAGIPTASEFSALMTKSRDKKSRGKTSITMLYKKAGELITGEPSESYSNEYMNRGNELEPVARDLYTQQTDDDVVQVGFMRNEIAGYSPDGVVGEDGLIEIKSRLHHIQVETLLRDSVPSQDIAQIQGGLWLSGRKWIDYVSYCPNMPLFIKRVFPDLEYHERLEREIISFNEELKEIVKSLINKF
jgi:hypothetical protein